MLGRESFFGAEILLLKSRIPSQYKSVFMKHPIWLKEMFRLKFLHGDAQRFKCLDRNCVAMLVVGMAAFNSCTVFSLRDQQPRTIILPKNGWQRTNCNYQLCVPVCPYCALIIHHRVSIGRKNEFGRNGDSALSPKEHIAFILRRLR